MALNGSSYPDTSHGIWERNYHEQPYDAIYAFVGGSSFLLNAIFLVVIWRSTLRGLSIAMVCGQSAIDCFFGIWTATWTAPGAAQRHHWGGEESCDYQGAAVTLSAMMTIVNFVIIAEVRRRTISDTHFKMSSRTYWTRLFPFVPLLGFLLALLPFLNFGR